MSEREPIVWQGQLVGWMNSPFPEMFNCSGLWEPVNPNDDTFWNAVKTGSSPGVEITFGNGRGIIYEPPDEEGYFAVSWW